jgi:replicative DNA helicase
MLERGERVMIVAAEGVGKTMLARQVAILSGAGVHPFTFGRMKPVRTLFVDLENPERIIRRTSRKILSAVRSSYDRKADPEAHLWIKPDGLNILKPADRALLEAKIEETKPELLVLGPLYKAFIDPGNRTAEATAIEVALILDNIRTTYGCALWLEHHAPLGNSLSARDLRPMGSAVWMRWPEFGYALAPDPTAVGSPTYEVKQWRGPRDIRQWPTKMKRGTLFPFEVIEYSS